MLRLFALLCLVMVAPLSAQVAAQATAPVFGPPAPAATSPVASPAAPIAPPLPVAPAPITPTLPVAPAPPPLPPSVILGPTPGYYPAYDYITIGQDEPGYRAWVGADPNRPVLVKSFNDYLVAAGVGGVAPTWQLLRTASQWQRCGAQPFEIPPTDGWANIVAALRYVGAFVMPKIGRVEPVSVYRNPALNRCAGGAVESTHRTVGAIDMVPLHRISREGLMTALCQLHLGSGTWNNVGLGLYKGVRFHIDAKKFREWGTAGARGDWGCTAVLAEGPMPFGAAPVTITATSTTPIAGSSESAPITARPVTITPVIVAPITALPVPMKPVDPLAPIPSH